MNCAIIIISSTIIIPVVAADFENNGIDGIKFLFSCFPWSR